jgi:hypothetical protein
MVTSHLLSFEAVPERVVLEGFSEEILRALGMFMADLSAVQNQTEAYRVVAGGAERHQFEAPKDRERRPWRRHVRHEGEDMVVMPGGRVRLAPGRAEAVVEWAVGSTGVDGFVAIALLRHQSCRRVRDRRCWLAGRWTDALWKIHCVLGRTRSGRRGRFG